jgi:hypothetical protein
MQTRLRAAAPPLSPFALAATPVLRCTYSAHDAAAAGSHWPGPAERR